MKSLRNSIAAEFKPITAVALPSTTRGWVAAMSLGLVWLPATFVAYLIVLGVRENATGGDIAMMLDAIFDRVLVGVAFTSEFGAPLVAGLAVGGLGLSFAWMSAQDLGKTAFGSVTAVLLTPSIGLFCLVELGDHSPWKFLGGCFLNGLFLSLPMWGLVWWAADRRVQRHAGLWAPWMCVGLSGLLGGMTQWAFRAAAETADTVRMLG